ncbi:MAG: hypothetical protein WCK60_01025 [Candidatus Nomurabacteria bacterium]
MKVTKVYANSSLPLNLKKQIKWVLIGDNLIIGNIMDHTVMVMETLNPGLFQKDPMGGMQQEMEYANQVIAAGIADINGNMVGWESTGFNKTTPDYMKKELSDLIKQIISEETLWQ